MKNLVLIIIGLIGIGLISSCNNANKAKVEVNLNDSISFYEKSLFGNEGMSKLDVEGALKLSNFYYQWALANKGDSLAPEYLLKSADIAMNMKKPVPAINAFNIILTDYPNHKNAPYALFLKAFVYEDILNNNDKARKFYQEFLIKYPDNEYADDVRISLKNLGKTPEELIREFENK
ncbi:MAG: hypothetical protein C0598_09590 [Marinilabiliales bacterium]|nr:MAG: hypothetical protein C0598_09590 [Marinilabiliales bacterium]